jgi:archaellum component FlaG (FlaF/FlaG flagellin family)
MVKRKALSRVLTEIIFILLGLTTAVGAYSAYNSSILSSGSVTKIVCTDTIIVAGAHEVQVVVKNLGNVAVKVSVDGVSEYGKGGNLTISDNSSVILEPGAEKMVSAKCDGLVAGLRYRIFVAARVDENIVGYEIVEAVALP